MTDESVSHKEAGMPEVAIGRRNERGKARAVGIARGQCACIRGTQLRNSHTTSTHACHFSTQKRHTARTLNYSARKKATAPPFGRQERLPAASVCHYRQPRIIQTNQLEFLQQ